MQLVGAKSFFIRRPFILKAFYQGLISAILAVLFLLFIWYSFIIINPNIVSELSTDKLLLNNKILDLSIIALGMLITGVLISVVSTYFALNKFIWVKSEKLY
jgi:cell division transport system permease protein